MRCLYWCAYHCLSLYWGYICSAKLVPVSQYLGTVLVCLLGVACLRGRAMDFCHAGGHWLTLEIKINVRQCRFIKTIFHQECLWGGFFSQRLWKMEKFRVPSVHHHSWWNEEESHTRKQGMATQHYIFIRCWINGRLIFLKIPQQVFIAWYLSLFTRLLRRKKWDATTSTSRTGLQISPGRKSTTRKWRPRLLQFHRQGHFIIMTLRFQ